jgi:hypothetical protein
MLLIISSPRGSCLAEAAAEIVRRRLGWEVEVVAARRARGVSLERPREKLRPDAALLLRALAPLTPTVVEGPGLDPRDQLRLQIGIPSGISKVSVHVCASTADLAERLTLRVRAIGMRIESVRVRQVSENVLGVGSCSSRVRQLVALVALREGIALREECHRFLGPNGIWLAAGDPAERERCPGAPRGDRSGGADEAALPGPPAEGPQSAEARGGEDAKPPTPRQRRPARGVMRSPRVPPQGGAS